MTRTQSNVNVGDPEIMSSERNAAAEVIIDTENEGEVPVAEVDNIMDFK